MGNLSVFLKANAIPVENTKFAASKRFVEDVIDETTEVITSKPVMWEIACITSGEDEILRKSCTKRIPVPGKRNQYTQETDYNLYVGKLAAKCTVFPDLDDAEIQNSYGVMGADSLLKIMLMPGEYTDYCIKVQEVNGFNVSLEEDVEEAKN